jgi:type I restriction enzyme, S subunit
VEVPFLPLEAIWPDDRFDSSRRRRKGEVSVGYMRFAEGDILLPKITPTFQADRTVIARKIEGGIGAATTEVHVVRVGRCADVRYVRYLLSSKPFLEEAEAAMVGVAGQKRVPDDCLRDLGIPVSNVEHQSAIADYLDIETARIDALVAKKRRMIGLLDERVQSVISAAMGSSIIYAKDKRPIGIEGVPCVRLGAVSRIQTGLTLDAGRDEEGEIITLPYLRVANVQDGSLDLRELKEVTVPRTLATRCTLKPHDVLMTEGGDPDKLGRGTVWPGTVAPCLHQNHVFAVRPNVDLLPEYLALVTRTPYARVYFEMTASKTTGIASTSASKIASFHVPLPSAADQRRVIHEVKHELGKIAAVRTLVTNQVLLLQKHRKALITFAVTGELDVSGVAE